MTESANIDPDALIEVDDVQKRGDVDYDLRYLPNREKWKFSQEAFEALNLEDHALREYVSEEGKIVVSVQDEEDSTFMKGRSDSEQKGKLFTNRKLREHLSQIGFEDKTHFALIPAGSDGDVEFFVVDAWGDRDFSPLLEARFEGSS